MERRLPRRNWVRIQAAGQGFQFPGHFEKGGKEEDEREREKERESVRERRNGGPGGRGGGALAFEPLRHKCHPGQQTPEKSIASGARRGCRSSDGRSVRVAWTASSPVSLVEIWLQMFAKESLEVGRTQCAA